METIERRRHRLELKYVIDEVTAAHVRRAVVPYCRQDPHAVATPSSRHSPDRGSYVVHSLYLDTPSLAFHRAKQRGDSERFKLRVRKYSSLGPFVLEIKRRTADFVEKTRTLVDQDDIRDAILRPRRGPTSPDVLHFREHFARLVMTTGAEPSLLIRYEREAYVSTVDDYARVTMDRGMAAQRTREWSLTGNPDAWCPLKDHARRDGPFPLTVLELKCQRVVPNWLTDIVRRYDLKRQSFSKYSIGIYVTRRVAGVSELTPRTSHILD